jgi:hypothetical protein
MRIFFDLNVIVLCFMFLICILSTILKMQIDVLSKYSHWFQVGLYLDF